MNEHVWNYVHNKKLGNYWIHVLYSSFFKVALQTLGIQSLCFMRWSAGRVLTSHYCNWDHRSRYAHSSHLKTSTVFKDREHPRRVKGRQPRNCDGDMLDHKLYPSFILCEKFPFFLFTLKNHCLSGNDVNTRSEFNRKESIHKISSE